MEPIVAFILIVAAATFIYVIGRRAGPKPAQSESELSMYACGENVPPQRIKVNVSLYKFLIYFVIFDSSVLLLAFAALLVQGTNTLLLVLYLFMMLASSVILLEGGKE